MAEPKKRITRKRRAVKAGLNPDNIPTVGGKADEPVLKRVYFRARRRGKDGRKPKLFKSPEEMMEALEVYANACARELKPFLKTGFCVFLGVSETALYNYQKDEEYAEVFEMMETLAKHDVLTGGLMERYSPTMAKFVLQNHHGYREKVDNVVEDKRAPALTVEIVEAEVPQRETAKISRKSTEGES